MSNDPADHRLQTAIIDLENIRRDIIKKYRNRLRFVAFAILILSIFFILLTEIFLAALIWLIFFPHITNFIKNEKVKAAEEYEKLYKNYIITKLSFLFDPFEYTKNKIIKYNDLKNSGIAAALNSYKDDFDTVIKFNDCFIGEYKDAHVKICDVNGNYHSDFQRSFQGLLIHIKLPEPKWTGQTVLASNKSASMNAEFAKELKKLNFTYSLFSQKFNVYSDNPVEGHYIFNPVIVERFLEISKFFDHSLIYTGFYNQSEVFMIINHGKDSFEINPDLKTPVQNLDVIKNISLELNTLKEMIEYLELIDKKEIHENA